METRCVRIKLKPGSLEKVAAWAAEIHARKTEAYAILKREGVVLETAFLDSVAGEHYLIYVMRAEDLEKSLEVSAISETSLDAFHQRFKKDCWETVQTLEQLIDLDAAQH